MDAPRQQHHLERVLQHGAEQDDSEHGGEQGKHMTSPSTEPMRRRVQTAANRPGYAFFEACSAAFAVRLA